MEIRKIVYTTNIIESLNRGIRKYTKRNLYSLMTRRPWNQCLWPSTISRKSGSCPSGTGA
ncbi:MAG: hypothetical protein JW861_00805 [Bacteroidales bacterium]|nr:hypothetical protein [Bacteroidales bacterium]